ncbi:MAG TPA: glycosyltransferase family 9 protein [Desulfonatronum sp.]|nr:glycosyltransferase family 9 protein [Desulfonatronum sp.]
MTPQAPRARHGKLIVVKLDQIGDYVLFRNFLEVLKNSSRFQSHELSLLGNKEYRPLAESLDGHVVDRFVWVDKDKFATWKLYRKHVLNKLRQLRFDVLISPLYSRENCWTEPVVEAINASEKIGSTGDLTNITAAHRFRTNTNYTRLIQGRDGVLFEFSRNKDFFEALLGQDIPLMGPVIAPGPGPSPTQGPYAILFPGAKDKYRRWSEHNFAAIADHLAQRHGLEIVICGSRQDKALAVRIQRGVSVPLTNLCGKTSLAHLPGIFHDARLVLTNDTSAHHIAAAVGVPTLCLSNGNTFGRFVPYPQGFSATVRYVYPPEIEQDLDDFNGLVEKYQYTSRLDINAIVVPTVARRIDDLLAQASSL